MEKVKADELLNIKEDHAMNALANMQNFEADSLLKQATFAFIAA